MRNEGSDATGDPRDGDDVDPFVEYYARESESEETHERFSRIRRSVLRELRRTHPDGSTFDVADIGCGAGAQCFLWTEEGHRVHGIDINEPLVELGRRRASERGLEVDFASARQRTFRGTTARWTHA